MMKKYAFWNNKGGTGKTSLIFQAALAYAKKHSNERILVMDVCPQANLSELMLGGLVGNGSRNLLQIQGQTPRSTVGGYFQMRLPQPYSAPAFTPNDYIMSPHDFNDNIPANIDLLPGDPLLELQATAISTLANTQIPGQNPWVAIINWLRDFVAPLDSVYSTAFIDCNPSFSIYTQIALAISDLLVVPVMADDSSRRALQNAFSLIYGLHLPSPIYAQHSFYSKLVGADLPLPKVHLIVKNRLTQYMGPASAYAAVLSSVDRQIQSLLSVNPDLFTFTTVDVGAIDMRDFGTTGVVAFAKGMPLWKMNAGRYNISGRRVTVKQDYLNDAIDAVNAMVSRL